MAEKGKKLGKRKSVGFIDTALKNIDTLPMHSDDELRHLINGCEELLKAAKQARLANADAVIAEKEAELEELRRLREEAQQ